MYTMVYNRPMKMTFYLGIQDGNFEKALKEEVLKFRRTYSVVVKGDAEIRLFDKDGKPWLALPDANPEDALIMTPAHFIIRKDRFDIISRAVDIWAKQYYSQIRYNEGLEPRASRLEYLEWSEKQRESLAEATFTFEVERREYD